MRITRSGKYLNEEPKDSTLNDRIKNQQKYFKWYYRIPLIILIATLIISVATGIYCAVITENGLIWFIPVAFGGLSGLIGYFLAKIILSQKILTVLYLQKLNEDKYD